MTSASMPSGTVLQIVTAEVNSGFSTTSTSLSDTGYTVTITPTATSSKIIVVASGNWGSSGDGRHGYDMQTNSSGSFATLDGEVTYSSWKKVHGASMDTMTAIETSIGTTNAVTYKMRARLITTGCTLYVPVSPSYSYIIAYEIAG